MEENTETQKKDQSQNEPASSSQPTAPPTSSVPTPSAAFDAEMKAQRVDLIAPAYRKTSVAKAYANALAELVKEEPRLQENIGEMVLLLDEVRQVQRPYLVITLVCVCLSAGSI